MTEVTISVYIVANSIVQKDQFQIIFRKKDFYAPKWNILAKRFSERLMWLIEQEQFCNYFFLKETLQFCNALFNLFHTSCSTCCTFGQINVWDLKSAFIGLAEPASKVQVRNKCCWIIWYFSFHSCISLVWGKYCVCIREFIKACRRMNWKCSSQHWQNNGSILGLLGTLLYLPIPWMLTPKSN